ncbi:MAG TPA: TPM domain-containing protein, partial [Clostridia bacterium]|nr:TPM domain-containing protein [Clostridia bacterium]
MKKTLYLIAFILLLIPINACIAEVTIPSHTQGFYVNDFANVLDSNTEDYILEQSIKLDELSGAQLVVVTVDTTDDRPLEEYALDILRDWGIGSRDKNNGALIFLAVEDRKSRIEVGYGLEGALPDGKTGWIQDEYMVPYFSVGDYSTGILEGYKAILLEIYNEYDIEPQGLENITPSSPNSLDQTEESETSGGVPAILFLIIVFVLFDLLFMRG